MYIKDMKKLEQETPIEGYFVVRSIDVPRDYRSGIGRYFFMEVSDKTGNMKLKYWGSKIDDAETMEIYRKISPGDVVAVKGVVVRDRYDGIPAISVDSKEGYVKKIEDVSEDILKDLIPHTDKNIDEMMNEIFLKIGSMNNEYLKSLLKKFFDDPSFIEKFKKAPSALLHHHCYIGGNLEHTLSVLKLCDLFRQIYPELNGDLLITGAILHDVGKIYEYKYDTGIKISESGKFMGHIIIGEKMIADKIKEIEGFPKELEMKLRHMILNHHGNPEEDRARGAKIPEAVALYHMDNADARIKEFLQEMKTGKEVSNDWYYSRLLGNEIYLR